MLIGPLAKGKAVFVTFSYTEHDQPKMTTDSRLVAKYHDLAIFPVMFLKPLLGHQS